MANIGLNLVFHWSHSFEFESSLWKSLMKCSKNYIKDFVNRIVIFLSSKSSDVFYVQRAFMWGLPSLLGRLSSFVQILMTFLIKAILRRKMIFDFDDAIYLKNPLLIYLLTRMSDCVIVSSHALQQYASRYNKHVYLIPTSIPTNERVRRAAESTNKSFKEEKIVIGWVGSSSTIKYLRILAEPLNLLGLDHDIEFRVMGARSKMGYARHRGCFSEFKNVRLVLISWTEEDELDEISQFDIGVAPLSKGPWEEGKCGFKLLMYMSMGIPCVASAVGENNFIIQDGENGFLCKNTKEYIEKLRLLIGNADLRKSIGIKGRRTIEAKYNLGSNAERLFSLIQKIIVENNI